MRKAITTILTLSFLIAMIPCVTGCNRSPVIWYIEPLTFYKNAIYKDGPDYNKDHQYSVAPELKDPNNEVGYLIKDLDGDGIEELLIGFNDGSNYTKFTATSTCAVLTMLYAWKILSVSLLPRKHSCSIRAEP